MFTQSVLRAELARRVAAAETGPDVRPAPVAAHSEPPGLLRLAEVQEAALETALETAPDVTAIAVLRHFDPAVFARSALEFALGVTGEARERWFRAFTRTLFLAGNPANLTGRFAFEHVTADRSIAWTGPAGTDRFTGLRRLLKRFDGAVEPELPPTVPVVVPGTGGGTAHLLQVVTTGVTLADYLVHVNHVLAEALLTGTIRPGDHVELAHVPRLGAVEGTYTALRVHRDSADPDRLRAYACLSH